jgi:hypothetical protein
VSRVLLFVALALSLWPAALVAYAVTSDTSDTSSNDPAVADPRETLDESEAAASTPEERLEEEVQQTLDEAEVDKYLALNRRMDRMLKRMDTSTAMRGIPDAKLERSAARLAEDIKQFRRGRIPSDVRPLALANQQLAGAVREFAEAPGQERLDEVNAAIGRFNARLDESQE